MNKIIIDGQQLEVIEFDQELNIENIEINLLGQKIMYLPGQFTDDRYN